MSYDITVHTRERTDTAGLVALVHTVRGLDATVEPGGLLVRRGGEYSFDLTEANATEPEDVPAEVEKVLDGTRWIHHIAVQGSGAAGTRDAVRFARALATAADGAVHDQNDGIWANGRTHRPRVRRDAVVDVLRLEWYSNDHRPDLGERWLELCRSHLPAALPRRFGDSEPFRHKLEIAGDAGFATAVRETSGLLFTAGTRPCFGATFTGGGPRPRFGPSHSHSLTVELTRLGGVAELFTGMAEAAGCFYAHATVERDLKWTGRSLFHDGPRTPYLAGLGHWLGLPPEAPEWTWFGPAYARLARVPAGQLLRWAGEPWLPTDLLVGTEPALTPAARMPRRRWWRR